MGSLMKKDNSTMKKVGVGASAVGSLACFFGIGGGFGIALGVGCLVLAAWFFWGVMKAYAATGRRF